jgi:hypothetical protein
MTKFWVKVFAEGAERLWYLKTKVV